MELPRALYLHVPFCDRICPYCAFNVTSRFDPGTLDQFIDTVALELDGLAPLTPLDLSTVYLGGGTPSVFDSDRLARLLEVVRKRLDSSRLVEWTVEANPDSITEEKARVMAALGVSRVSLGAQSLKPRFLARLGRTHTPDDVRRAVEDVRKAGFSRINVDLIYGQPEQTLADWAEDVDSVLALDVSHVSLYELTFEPGTPFGRGLEGGRMTQADDGLAVSMFWAARERLSARGIEWYEVSNFARPGHESEHNRTYWRNEPYYGIGPGAWACVDGVRTRNACDLAAWRLLVESSGSGVEEREPLSPRHTFVETLAAGLRTREGVDLADLRRRTGLDFTGTERRHVQDLVAKGLAEVLPDRLRLTLAGVLLLDSIMLPFVEVPHAPAGAAPR